MNIQHPFFLFHFFRSPCGVRHSFNFLASDGRSHFVAHSMPFLSS